MADNAVWLPEEDLKAFDTLAGAATYTAGGAAEKYHKRLGLLRKMMASEAAREAWAKTDLLAAWPEVGLPPRPKLYAGVECGDCRGPVAMPSPEAHATVAAFGACYRGCKASRERIAKAGQASQPDAEA